MKFSIGDIISHNLKPHEYYLISGVSPCKTRFRLTPLYYDKTSNWEPGFRQYSIEYINLNCSLITNIFRQEEDI